MLVGAGSGALNARWRVFGVRWMTFQNTLNIVWWVFIVRWMTLDTRSPRQKCRQSLKRPRGTFWFSDSLFSVFQSLKRQRGRNDFPSANDPPIANQYLSPHGGSPRALAGASGSDSDIVICQLLSRLACFGALVLGAPSLALQALKNKEMKNND